MNAECSESDLGEEAESGGEGGAVMRLIVTSFAKANGKIGWHSLYTTAASAAVAVMVKTVCSRAISKMPFTFGSSAQRMIF